MGYSETFNEWKRFAVDEQIAAELLEIESDESEKKSRFSSAMTFGTAGLRSKLGAGTNRMNIYTVGQATQGLAQYVIAKGKQQAGMVVAYDTRRNSDVFAQTTARIFAANGIKTYLFEAHTSVPELSFAIRKLNAFGGVAITASHNPKEYNGYKAYAAWGGQLLDDASREVIRCVAAVEGTEAVKSMEVAKAIAQGKIVMLGKDMDNAYYDALLTVTQRQENIDKYAKDIKFVYTSLFGTGMRTFDGVMRRLPYQCSVVESQCVPNSEFPGLDAPNPEDERAMSEAIQLAQEIGAELAFGTDPDADRLGAAIPNERGEFIMLSGNQVACIIIDYLLRHRKQTGQLLPSDFTVKSFVSSHMVDDMARFFGINSITVPTGFKYISDMVHNRQRGNHFVFGFEESCGFLTGSFVADKDGVLAGLLLLEVLCECKSMGESLYGRLKSMYAQYGWHKEKVVYTMIEGEDCMDQVGKIMESLRNAPPETIGGQSVVSRTDYKSGEQKGADGERIIDFPRSNALEFTLEHGWLAIRPSGTEPKIRVYFGVKGEDNDSAQAMLDALEGDATALLKRC